MSAIISVKAGSYFAMKDFVHFIDPKEYQFFYFNVFSMYIPNCKDMQPTTTQRCASRCVCYTEW